jgi:hypothetical protein
VVCGVLSFSHWDLGSDRTPSSLVYLLSSLLSEISCAASCCSAAACWLLLHYSTTVLLIPLLSSRALSCLAESTLSIIAFDSYKHLTVTWCNINLQDKNQREVQWTLNIGASSWNKFTEYWLPVRTFQFRNRFLSDKRIHLY